MIKTSTRNTNKHSNLKCAKLAALIELQLHAIKKLGNSLNRFKWTIQVLCTSGHSTNQFLKANARLMQRTKRLLLAFTRFNINFN